MVPIYSVSIYYVTWNSIRNINDSVSKEILWFVQSKVQSYNFAAVTSHVIWRVDGDIFIAIHKVDEFNIFESLN